MKAIADGRKWIDAYVAKKDKTLGEVAKGLRRLVHKTIANTKESVNPWKVPLTGRQSGAEAHAIRNVSASHE